MSIKTVVKNGAWIGLVQILNLALPLLTFPLISRAFGPALYGLIATLTAAIAYVGLVVLFGFHLTGPRLIARTSPDPRALSTAFSTIFLGQLVIAAGASVLCVLGLWLLGPSPTSHVLGIGILVSVVATTLTPTWMFIGLQSVREIALSQFILRAGAAAIIVMTVRHEGDATLFVAVNAIGSVLGCFSSLVILARKGIRLRTVAPATIVRSVHSASRLFLSAASINLYTSTNIVVVGCVLGSAAAGPFALADRVRGAVVGLFDPVSQALYPYLCRQDAGGVADQEAGRRLFFRGIVVLSALASVLLYLGAPYISIVLGGARFGRSVPLLEIFSVTPFLICLANILGLHTMLPNDMERELSRIVAVAGLAGVPLVVAATLLAGLEGAAWSYVIIEVGVTLAMAVCIRQRQSLWGLFFRPAARPVSPKTV